MPVTNKPLAPHWNWNDIVYIDDIRVTCSGGIKGVAKHAPTNMIMGINDVVLVCPKCNIMYGNKQRMNSVGVQAQVNEANVRKDRIKSVGKSKFQKIIDLFK
jgi:hypothetical protein